jgi:hypothetical protein
MNGSSMRGDSEKQLLREPLAKWRCLLRQRDKQLRDKLVACRQHKCAESGAANEPRTRARDRIACRRRRDGEHSVADAKRTAHCRRQLNEAERDGAQSPSQRGQHDAGDEKDAAERKTRVNERTSLCLQRRREHAEQEKRGQSVQHVALLAQEHCSDVVLQRTRERKKKKKKKEKEREKKKKRKRKQTQQGNTNTPSQESTRLCSVRRQQRQQQCGDVQKRNDNKKQKRDHK